MGLMEKLIEALEANTAALLAAGGKSSGATGTTGDKDEVKKPSTRGGKKTEEKTKEVNREDVVTVWNDLKEKIGTEATKKAIKSKLKVEKLGELEDDDLAKALEVGQELLAEAQGGDL